MKHLLLALLLTAILATPAQAQQSPATAVTRKAHQLLGNRSGGIMCWWGGTKCNVVFEDGTIHVYFDRRNVVQWYWIPKGKGKK